MVDRAKGNNSDRAAFLQHVRQRVAGTLKRARAAHDKANQLGSETAEVVAEAHRVQAEARVMWTSHTGHITCTHTIHSETDHEVAVTLEGSQVWSTACRDSDDVVREAERLRQLFGGD